MIRYIIIRYFPSPRATKAAAGLITLKIDRSKQLDEAAGAIIFVVILLILAFAFWPITLSLIAACAFIHFTKKENERKRLEQEAIEKKRLDQEMREKAIRAAREKEIKDHKNQQERLLKELQQSVSSSVSLFEMIPKKLLAAEMCLDQATSDYAEGAFAPFWDSIEKATILLGQIDDDINRISANSAYYTLNIKAYEGVPPAFPVKASSTKSLVVTNQTTDRLNKIVRKAQCNFQFATIYEQRKTNQILVAGFTSLAQALDGMTRRIVASITDLESSIVDTHTSFKTAISTASESVASMQNSLSDAFYNESNNTRDSLNNSARSLEAAFRQQANERSQREKRALEMLDNIQRRRRPWP